MIFSTARTLRTARARGVASLALLAAASTLSACGRDDRIPTPTTDAVPNEVAEPGVPTTPSGGVVGGLDASTSTTAGVSPSGTAGGTFGINSSGTESIGAVMPETLNLDGSLDTGAASAAWPVMQAASGAVGN
jgi:hypothetical protein